VARGALDVLLGNLVERPATGAALSERLFGSLYLLMPRELRGGH
jgi:hypothetical protein